MSDTPGMPPAAGQSAQADASNAGRTSRLAQWTVTLIAAALFLDAAVETLWSGSPVRWWAVGVAVVYLMAAAVMWRTHAGAGARAGFAGLVVLVLLAITAWLPGGLTLGVRLLGHPTPIVLCAATLAALVVGGVAILRATATPLAARLIAVLLVVYGATAFGLGAWNATAYPALFAGESVWRSAPRWLQGSVVGGLVALPLALIVNLLGGLQRGKREWRFTQIVALGLSLVIVAAGFTQSSGIRRDGITTGLAAAPSAGSGSAAVSSPPVTSGAGSSEPASSFSTASTAPVDYVEALAKLRASIDYSEIDPQARQAKIGTDPEAISKFVQTRIRYEPYSGALRGARGTLLARAGNSVDRTLLLAAMLRTAGHKVRFAEGTLSNAQAEQLIRTAFPPRPPAFKGGSPLMAITRRALSHFLYLGDTLHAGQFRAPQGDAGAWDRSVREAIRHYWVQVDAGGRWVDVDTSPGVPYGQSLTRAVAQSEQPDSKLFHTVEIRVDVETIHDGKRQTTSALQYSARAVDLAGMPIGMFHERKGDGYTPVLMAGERLIRGEALQMPPVIGLGDARAPVVNPFATGTDRTSGEWLRFRVEGPAGVREAAYTIVDTEGPAARQAGSPPKGISVENLAAVSEAFDAVVGVGISTGQVPPALLAAMMVDVTDPSSESGLVRVMSMTALTYHAVRGELPSSFLTPRPLWYVDAPSVVVARAQLRSDPPVATLSLDLTLKGYRVLRTPDDPFGGRGAFYDYLAAGVLDHTAERWIVGAEQAAGSVGALFEAAVEQKIPARMSAAAGSLPDALLTPDGRLRLSSAVSKGLVAIVPGDRPREWKPLLGWWSVDRATGWTEDTAEDGGHQTGDYSTSVRTVSVPASQRYALLGCRVLGVGLMAAGTLQGMYGSPELGPLAAAWAAAAVGGAILMGCGSGSPPPAEPGAPPGAPPPPGATGGPSYAPVRNPPVRANPMVYRPTEPGLPLAETMPEGGEWKTLPGNLDTIPDMPKIPWGG